MKHDSKLSGDVGRRLTELMELQHLSNEDIADVTWVGIPMVRAYKRGDNLLTMEGFYNLVCAYSVDPRWLLLGEKYPMFLDETKICELSSQKKFEAQVYKLLEILKQVPKEEREKYLVLLMALIGNGMQG